MIEYLKARLKEPSTWRNAVLLLGALLGITLQEQDIEVIVQVAIAIAGLIGVTTPDKVQ
ncbi:MAG: hypothetical protein ACREXW_01055 [Gammaproteobacteria bacterium]